jgi:hypothetical protein
MLKALPLDVVSLIAHRLYYTRPRIEQTSYDIEYKKFLQGDEYAAKYLNVPDTTQEYKALISMSLVSRSWREMARPYLFRHFLLRFDMLYGQDKYPRNEEGGLARLNFMSQYSWVAELVTEITVEGDGDDLARIESKLSTFTSAQSLRLYTRSSSREWIGTAETLLQRYTMLGISDSFHKRHG